MDRRDIDTSAGIYDLETADWDQYVLGGHISNDGNFCDWSWKDEDDFADFLFGLEGNLWAHNGGRFDHKWLLDHARKRGLAIRVALSGSSIVRGWIGKPGNRAKLALMDSYALFKIPLSGLTESQNVKKEKLDASLFPCVCDSGCGGYCSIRRELSKEQWDNLRFYLRRDCQSLLESINRFRAFAEQCDIDLGATVGSSAFRNAKRFLDLKPNGLTSGEHKKVREAYYGGRTQVFRPRASRGFSYDVNAMYPSRLHKDELPFGEYVACYGRFAASGYLAGHHGAYRASVSVPQCHIPPLPYRTKNRIAFPVGDFTGWWAGVELRYAEYLGVKIKEIHEAVYWKEKRNVFAPWIEKITDLRFNAPGGKGGPLGTFLKYYANSLTGKLGANPEMEEVLFEPQKLEPGMSEIGPDTGIYTRTVWRMDDCMHPEWSGHLTATARIELHKQLTADGCGGLSAIYSDTDSVFALTERTHNVGDKLGQWKREKEFLDFEAIAPKVYTYRYAGEGGEDKWTVRAKGARVSTPEQFEKVRSGQTITYNDGIIGFRVGAKRGQFFQKQTISRTFSVGYGDRYLVGGEGFTRPREAKELESDNYQPEEYNG